MNTSIALNVAASSFVRAEYRDRFVHEAARKPGKLMTRICHQIESVFESRFRGGKCAYGENDACLLFTLTGRQTVSTWRSAMEEVKRGGGGILIIDGSGKRFFAQSEGFPPLELYAGDA